ncbi:phosphatidylinositol 3-kinase C2 domain-containing subunit gamma-like, partial [Anomaloglossus baeobatrachus]
PAGVIRVLEAVKEICYLLRSVETPEISAAACALSVTTCQTNWTQSAEMTDPAPIALLGLSRAISKLLSVYSQSFHTDFITELDMMSFRMETRSAFLSFRLSAAHNLPENWTKSDSLFYVSCSVIYAGRKICPEVNSRSVAATGSFFFRAVWDEMERSSDNPRPGRSALTTGFVVVILTLQSGKDVREGCSNSSRVTVPSRSSHVCH